MPPPAVIENATQYFDLQEAKREAAQALATSGQSKKTLTVLTTSLAFADDLDEAGNRNRHTVSTAVTVMSSLRKFLHSSLTPDILMDADYTNRILDYDAFDHKRFVDEKKHSGPLNFVSDEEKHATITVKKDLPASLASPIFPTMGFLVMNSSTAQFTQRLNFSNQECADSYQWYVQDSYQEEIFRLVNHLVQNTRYFCRSLKTFVSNLCDGKTIELVMKNTTSSLEHIDISRRFSHYNRMDLFDFCRHFFFVFENMFDIVPKALDKKNETNKNGGPYQSPVVLPKLRTVNISGIITHGGRNLTLMEFFARRFGSTLESLTAHGLENLDFERVTDLAFDEEKLEKRIKTCKNCLGGLAEESSLIDRDNFVLRVFETPPVFFPKLKYLDIMGVTKGAAEYSWNCDFDGIGKMPVLETLLLGNTWEFDSSLIQGVISGAESRPQGGLKKLDLSHHDDGYIGDLFEDGDFADPEKCNLTWLDLSGNEELSEFIGTLAPIAPKLKFFKFEPKNNESVEEEGFVELLGAMENIESLFLGRIANFPEDALTALNAPLRAGRLKNLILNLCGQKTLTEDAFTSLFDGLTVENNNVEVLEIGGSSEDGLTDAALKNFLATASKLKFLSLVNCSGITDETLGNIAASMSDTSNNVIINNLEGLNIHKCNIKNPHVILDLDNENICLSLKYLFLVGDDVKHPSRPLVDIKKKFRLLSQVSIGTCDTYEDYLLVMNQSRSQN